MKVSIISTIFATLLAASSAAPFDTSCQSQVDALRQIQIDALRLFDITATFYGAAGASFKQQFPADGKIYRITNPLSVSYIQVEGAAICTFYGIDQSVTHVIDGQVVPVGPPQTQVFGTCTAL
ncbi:hypothetical protein V8E54_009679 [Elaphomyces granulatus]